MRFWKLMLVASPPLCYMAWVSWPWLNELEVSMASSFFMVMKQVLFMWQETQSHGHDKYSDDQTVNISNNSIMAMTHGQELSVMAMVFPQELSVTAMMFLKYLFVIAMIFWLLLCHGHVTSYSSSLLWSWCFWKSFFCHAHDFSWTCSYCNVL